MRYTESQVGALVTASLTVRISVVRAYFKKYT